MNTISKYQYVKLVIYSALVIISLVVLGYTYERGKSILVKNAMLDLNLDLMNSVYSKEILFVESDVLLFTDQKKHFLFKVVVSQVPFDERGDLVRKIKDSYCDSIDDDAWLIYTKPRLLIISLSYPRLESDSSAITMNSMDCKSDSLGSMEFMYYEQEILNLGVPANVLYQLEQLHTTPIPQP